MFTQLYVHLLPGSVNVVLAKTNKAGAGR